MLELWSIVVLKYDCACCGGGQLTHTTRVSLTYESNTQDLIKIDLIHAFIDFFKLNYLNYSVYPISIQISLLL